MCYDRNYKCVPEVFNLKMFNDVFYCVICVSFDISRCQNMEYQFNNVTRFTSA